MKVLVLGGTGFVGRHAAAALRARGHAVVIGTRHPRRALAKLPAALRDGDGGFGAAWLRRVARWPVHFAPSEARGRVAALDVRDLADALVSLCEISGDAAPRAVELGGSACRTMAEYLGALRAMHDERPALRLAVPAPLARVASHLCDLLHFLPFSYGHLE